MRILLAFLIFLQIPLDAYEKPSALKDEVWEEARPFLLPSTHPAVSFLDGLFQKRRVTLSVDSLKKSGFINIKQQPFTKMSTAIHKDLPGLFFKIYLDAQKPYKRKPEYFHWQCRIKGANLIRALVEKNGWEDSFKIPKKWMYPVPSIPAPSILFKGVTFILIEEDMQLLPEKKNLEMWRSSRVTKEFLDQLLTILNTIGLADCCNPKNIPFSEDGRVAFIDTQTSMIFPVPTQRMSCYLSKEMKAYWEKISKDKKLKS